MDSAKGACDDAPLGGVVPATRTQVTLFATESDAPTPAQARPRGERPEPKRGARLREANRTQISWGRIDLDAALPEDHPARAIWAIIERLNLGALYARIEARDGVAFALATDFRSQEAEVKGKLITQVLALLMEQNLIDLSRVAQDGTRVRASAGASSFRRAQTLEALMAQAREHLLAVTREAADRLSPRARQRHANAAPGIDSNGSRLHWHRSRR